MNDIMPGFVYTADLIKQANETEKWVKSKYTRERAAKIGWKVFAIAGWFVAVLAVGALDYAVPAIRLLPVFFYQKPDGVVETAMTTDSLPADLSDVNIQAWLWQYVQWRESYSWAEYLGNGYRVCAMSSEAVCSAYQIWADGKNKDSFVSVYNTRGVIRTAMAEVTHYERATASRPGEYTVHLNRQVDVDGDPHHQIETWSVTLKFLQDYSRGLRINDIRSFNPSRIVVVSYPGPQVISPKPSTIEGGGR